MIRKKNLDPSLINWIMAQTGLGPGMGDIGYLCNAVSSTNKFRQMLLDNNVADNNLYSTLVSAEAAITNYQNDVIIVMPGWYAETATTTWDVYQSHLIGSSPTVYQPMVDIVQTTNSFSPAWTLSGRGNSWRNLTFRHGVGASDLIGLTLSGRYNYLDNVYMMSPMVSAQDIATSVIPDSGTGYHGIYVSGHNNYFRNCRIGGEGTARDQINFNLTVGGIGNVFEDCLFTMKSDGTSPNFVCVHNATDMRYLIFKNCSFIAYSQNNGYPLLDAFTTKGLGGGTVQVSLENCNFVGVSNVCDGTHDKWIWKSVQGATVTVSAGMLSQKDQGA